MPKVFTPTTPEKLPKDAVKLTQAATELGIPVAKLRQQAIDGKFASIEFGKVGKGVGRYITAKTLDKLRGAGPQ